MHRSLLALPTRPHTHPHAPRRRATTGHPAPQLAAVGGARSRGRARRALRVSADLGGMLDTAVTAGAAAAGLGAALLALFADRRPRDARGGGGGKQQQQRAPPADESGNFKWGIMGAISCFPLFNWMVRAPPRRRAAPASMRAPAGWVKPGERARAHARRTRAAFGSPRDSSPCPRRRPGCLPLWRTRTARACTTCLRRSTRCPCCEAALSSTALPWACSPSAPRTCRQAGRLSRRELACCGCETECARATPDVARGRPRRRCARAPPVPAGRPALAPLRPQSPPLLPLTPSPPLRRPSASRRLSPTPRPR
jgi:hypothetical protein